MKALQFFSTFMKMHVLELNKTCCLFVSSSPLNLTFLFKQKLFQCIRQFKIVSRVSINPSHAPL
jgi:hypothetical protein